MKKEKINFIATKYKNRKIKISFYTKKEKKELPKRNWRLTNKEWEIVRAILLWEVVGCEAQRLGMDRKQSLYEKRLLRIIKKIDAGL